ncbi:MAG: histidine phosphatase family protein [Bacilli bacterium]|nr:histidine phosphatase family protein [Bacilli bacterium]
MKEIDYDIVISSPLLRAKHTAEIINVNNKEILLDDRIQERKHGSLEGQSIEVTDREEYWNFYTDIKYGTEESIPDLFKRVEEFLNELKTKEYKSILIVAHSGVSKAFYAYFNGIPKDGKFLNLGLGNTEIKKYDL